jgi:hypothetical protein
VVLIFNSEDAEGFAEGAEKSAMRLRGDIYLIEKPSGYESMFIGG